MTETTKAFLTIWAPLICGSGMETGLRFQRATEWAQALLELRWVKAANVKREAGYPILIFDGQLELVV